MPTKVTAKKPAVLEVESPKKVVATEVVQKITVKDKVTPLLVGAIIIMAFLLGYLYGRVEKLSSSVTPSAQPSAQVAQPTQKAVTVSIDRIRELMKDSKNVVFGDPKKKLLFVEFSDPSCPYCHIAAGYNSELNKQVGDRFILKADGGTYVAPVQEMKKLVDQGKAAYVWFYSPGHGNGELATQALYCAKEQNKFWEAHALLMSNTGYTLLNETVQNDVKKANVMADFLKGVLKASDLEACLTSGKYADRVKSDEALSREFGVQGTPSFFVNEKNFAGAYSYTDIASTVEAAMK